MKKVVFIYGGGDRVKDTFCKNIPAGFEVVCLPKEASDADKTSALAEAEYLVLHPAVIADELLQKSSKLKLVQLLTAGFDKMNIGLCKEKGIMVATNGGANSWSVAEHSVALLLGVYRRIVDCDKATRAGFWRKPIPEFTQFEIAGKTVAVLGAGNIGRRAAKRYKAFDADILYYDVAVSEYMEKELGAKKATIEEIARTADVISIHLPLFDSTRGIIGKKEFDLMKPEMVIINTGRAEIIDESALVEALQQKKIMAAGLDVFHEEPINLDNPLLKMDNVLLSPHMAGHSSEGWTRRCAIAWENIQLIAKGEVPKSQLKL